MDDHLSQSKRLYCSAISSDSNKDYMNVYPKTQKIHKNGEETRIFFPDNFGSDDQASNIVQSVSIPRRPHRIFSASSIFNCSAVSPHNDRTHYLFSQSLVTNDNDKHNIHHDYISKTEISPRADTRALDKFPLNLATEEDRRMKAYSVASKLKNTLRSNHEDRTKYKNMSKSSCSLIDLSPSPMYSDQKLVDIYTPSEKPPKNSRTESTYVLNNPLADSDLNTCEFYDDEKPKDRLSCYGTPNKPSIRSHSNPSRLLSTSNQENCGLDKDRKHKKNPFKLEKHKLIIKISPTGSRETLLSPLARSGFISPCNNQSKSALKKEDNIFSNQNNEMKKVHTFNGLSKGSSSVKNQSEMRRFQTMPPSACMQTFTSAQKFFKGTKDLKATSGYRDSAKITSLKVSKPSDQDDTELPELVNLQHNTTQTRNAIPRTELPARVKYLAKSFAKLNEISLIKDFSYKSSISIMSSSSTLNSDGQQTFNKLGDEDFNLKFPQICESIVCSAAITSQSTESQDAMSEDNNKEDTQNTREQCDREVSLKTTKQPELKPTAKRSSDMNSISSISVLSEADTVAFEQKNEGQIHFDFHNMSFAPKYQNDSQNSFQLRHEYSFHPLEQSLRDITNKKNDDRIVAFKKQEFVNTNSNTTMSHLLINSNTENINQSIFSKNNAFHDPRISFSDEYDHRNLKSDIYSRYSREASTLENECTTKEKNISPNFKKGAGSQRAAESVQGYYRTYNNYLKFVSNGSKV